MQAQSLVEVLHDRGGNDAQPFAKSLKGDRSDLLGLCLGVATQARLRGRKQDLERVDAFDIGCDRDNGDHTTTESGGRRVGRVIAHDDCRPPLVGLGTACWIEINRMDVAASDHDPSPSPVVESQGSLSSEEAHSRHADS